MSAPFVSVPEDRERAGPARPVGLGAQNGGEGTPDCLGHGASKVSGSAGMPTSAPPNVSR